ncbi:ImmA/IrrE family metallo-endopeptidase [Lactobacillus gasseri]|uniref:ImmA/IrrE family metallo-endopeptidase n=1 Tax=Lactobacillus gasseri TaxID=1596 RepID=UPI001587F233|nr:ImmA/IrrE family metallo-endopeptidase [Lactobacillus gasseri]
MEFELVSPDAYRSCQEIANRILEQTSIATHKGITKLRANDALTYLNNRYSPQIVFYYAKPEDDYDDWHVADNQVDYLANANAQFDMRNINIHATELITVDEIFARKVSGFTFLKYQPPILNLNISTSNFERILFTALHEYTHMYQSERDPDYARAAALINTSKSLTMSYPEEYQPLETEANIVASLLIVPDSSLDADIRLRNFNEIRNKYSISAQALHNRLINYFYFNCDFDYTMALQATLGFRKHNIEVIKQVRQHLRKS